MHRSISLILLLLLVAGAAAAQTGPKQLSAGVGVYVVSISDDDDRDNLEGYALTATMALGPGSAVRGHLYFTKHEDNDETKLEGFDAQFLLGSNITRPGFKMYALGGYWNETWKQEETTAKTEDVDLDFSGFMAGLGLGYNWPSATLDFWVAWRHLGDYEDLFGEDSDITMGAGALTFGLRF